MRLVLSELEFIWVAYYRATSFKRVIFIGTMRFGLYASPSRLEMPPENWACDAAEMVNDFVARLETGNVSYVKPVFSANWY